MAVALGVPSPDRVISEAREVGYSRMLLNSLPSLSEALGLYCSLGFREIPRYESNPDPHALLMALDLKTEKVAR